MEQATLPGMENESPDPVERGFFRFHKANPAIYRMFAKTARTLKRAGVKKVSSRLVIERVRNCIFFKAKGETEIRINNNFTALYARLIMRQEPDLAGFIRITKRRSAVPGAYLGD